MQPALRAADSDKPQPSLRAGFLSVFTLYRSLMP